MSNELEYLLAGFTMANPKLGKKVPKKLLNNLCPAASSVIQAIKEGEDTYASPIAMYNYLQASDWMIDRGEIDLIFKSIPEPEEANLDRFMDIVKDVEKSIVERKFKAELTSSLTRLTAGGSTPLNLLPEINNTISDYLTGISIKDNTITGIFDRMIKAPPLARFRSGIDALDLLFSGFDKEGKYACGLLGKSEVVGIAAGYKTGKTRLLYNILGNLLDQGASVAMFCLEDSDQKYLKKLMCAYHNIGLKQMDRFLVTGGEIDPQDLITYDESGDTIYKRCVEAIAWAKLHAQQLRIYDSTDGIGFGKFKNLMGLIQSDVLRFNTEVVIVDYVGKISSTFEDLNIIANELSTLAVMHSLAVIEIHQFSIDSIKNGPGQGLFGGQGTGAFGASLHVGINLYADKVRYGSEICLDMCIAREAESARVYYKPEPSSGYIGEYYETPYNWPSETSNKYERKKK